MQSRRNLDKSFELPWCIFKKYKFILIVFCQIFHSFCLFYPLQLEITKVVNCGDPSANVSAMNQEFLTASPPSSTVYLTVASVKCIQPFTFADGGTSKNITCLATETWSQFSLCLGNLSKYLYIQ